MSNCCMRRPAKFYVDSAVRFWAIANIREGGGVKRPPGQARVKQHHSPHIPSPPPPSPMLLLHPAKCHLPRGLSSPRRFHPLPLFKPSVYHRSQSNARPLSDACNCTLHGAMRTPCRCCLARCYYAVPTAPVCCGPGTYGMPRREGRGRHQAVSDGGTWREECWRGLVTWAAHLHPPGTRSTFREETRDEEFCDLADVGWR